METMLKFRCDGCDKEFMSRAERNCTSRAEQNCTTERRGVSIKVPWSVRA